MNVQVILLGFTVHPLAFKISQYFNGDDHCRVQVDDPVRL